MKKVILAAIVALAASIGLVQASEYIGIDVGQSSNKNLNSTDANYGIVTYGQKLGNFDVEGRLGFARTTDTHTDSTLAEVRGRYNFGAIEGLKPWVRGTVGEQFVNSQNAGYWGVEPGVGYNVTPALRADVSVLRTELFNRTLSANDQTTYIVGAAYALDNKNSVDVRYYKAIDGAQPQTFEVGYARSF